MLPADTTSLVPLACLTLFGLVAFWWRLWLQHRRTGDWGFRGFSRTLPEWAGWIPLLLGILAAYLGPVADLLGFLPRWEALMHPGLRVVAVLLMLGGMVLTVGAQLQMGASWRIGVAAQETTALVTHGVFRRIRNPIFTGMMLTFAGCALYLPNLVTVGGLALSVIGLEIQVRWVEEPYLTRVHGSGYRQYAGRAGRFVPGVGRLR